MKRPSVVFYVALFTIWWLLGVSLWKILIPAIIAAVISVLVRKYVFEVHLQVPPPVGAAVFITGCSSGFGKGFAHRLVQRGLVVYAGVRKLEDGDKIRNELPVDARARLVPVLVDVTKSDQIDSARDFVANKVGEAGLYAVINNAGIQCAGPVETVHQADLRNVFEVNVLGAVAVSQAFAPLLRSYSTAKKARSHLIFISSGAGLMVSPFMTTYCATKHAIEAFCDGLRVELRPFNINVSSIEPGSYKTEITKQFPDEAPRDGGAATLYRRRYMGFLAMVAAMVKGAPEPTPVTDLLERVLFARFPPSRALIGNDVVGGVPVGWLMPDVMLDGIMAGLGLLSNRMIPKEEQDKKSQ